MRAIVNKSTAMGVKTNKKKFCNFSDEQKFIGFVWNAHRKTVRLPEGKIKERIGQIAEFLQEGRSFSYGDVEILVGRMNHILYMLTHLNSLYRWLKLWVHHRALRPPPQDALKDLHLWKETLKNFEETQIICWGDPVDIKWVGDASTKFGIGVLIGDFWAQFKILNPERKEQAISLLETVAIRLGLIMAISLESRAGKTLIVNTDNTTSEACVNNKKSRGTQQPIGRSQPPFAFPATREDIHEFCTWAGRGPSSGNKPILATTLTKYLCGLQAWHVFHNQEYPALLDKKTALLLKSSAKLDAMEIAGGVGVLKQDVTWGLNKEWARITLREAKTAIPGTLQFIKVDWIPNCLCPVAALERLAKSCQHPTGPLFGFQVQNSRTALTRYMLTACIGEVWRDLGQPTLTRHLFRVGGALFRHAMGVSPTDICAAGRWVSNCYKLYIQEYSPGEMDDTIEFLTLLDGAWCA
ncbi:hypothetical protein PCANC_27299 [Puccinia coronata f. sp. avenae]|uniref:Tyr recombinase domain-containing protein n=1 Tax=Puccinia coronata f. sp. avenae TaxID=200324 RepID=A0A2N5SC58_9BASI|nr:hypothetical protein PCANC_27299 [Puccinia coronata f. sp. avenae]